MARESNVPTTTDEDSRVADVSCTLKHKNEQCSDRQSDDSKVFLHFRSPLSEYSADMSQIVDIAIRIDYTI